MQELYAEEIRKQCGKDKITEFTSHPQEQICLDFLDKFLTFAKTTLHKDTAWNEVYRFQFRPTEVAGAIRVDRLFGKPCAPYQFLDPKFREWLKK